MVAIAAKVDGAIGEVPGTGALSLPAATIGLGVFLAVVSSFGEREQLVWNRDAPPPAGVPSDGAPERHQGAALLGGEAIEQPVAAGAAQVGLATAAIGPARGMR